MFKKGSDEVDDFRKKREEYAINIRRNNREEMLNKRRNIVDYSLKSEQSDEMKNIVDLRYIKEIKQLHQQKYNPEMLEQYEAMLQHKDPMVCLRGAVAIRVIVEGQNNNVINKLFERNVIPKLTSFLTQSEYPQLKLQAMMAFSHMTYPNDICQKLVTKGLIEITIKILQQNQIYIVDHAITTLGNIAADSTKLRDIIFKSGGLQAVYKCLGEPKRQQTYFNCLWILSNFARGSPLPSITLFESSISIFCTALKNNFSQLPSNSQQAQTLSDVLWAIYSMTNNSKARLDRVIEANVIPILFQYANSSQSFLYFPALRIIGSIASEGEKLTNQLINNGLFDLSINLLNHKKSQVRDETCWILSNIAAGTQSQIQKFLTRVDILNKVNQMLQTESKNAKLQICWIFANIGHLGDKSKVLQVYMHYDIMKSLISMLDSLDSQLLQNTLKVINRILMVGNKFLIDGNNVMLMKFLEYQGVPILEKLQAHESGTVYKSAVNILNTFFDLDDPNS